MDYSEIQTQAPHHPMDTYQVSTPFGIVTITHGGRKVNFELYSDVRQSRHNTALFAYVQQLIARGITEFNVDHFIIAGRNRLLPLKRGKAKLDLVYIEKGKLHECELKTNREIGLDITAQQLREMVKHCQHLTLLVPRGSTEEARTVLTMINLDGHVTIEPYDNPPGEE